MFIVENFTEFPDEIDGCACYYARTKDNLYRGNYVYTDNHSDLAFMKINGRMEPFMLLKKTEVSSKHWIKVFSNSSYTITVDSEQNWQVDQVWHQNATITVKNKKGQELVEYMYGECGC